MESRNGNLNVLLVVPWDQEVGGVAEVVGYLATHLQSEGHRVLFLHPGTNEVVRRKKTKWGFEGVELKLRAPFNPNYPFRSVLSFLAMFPFTLVQLAMIIHANGIRVVNIHYPGEHFVYFAFCRYLLRVRLVISIHGTDAIRWETRSVPRSNAVRLLFSAADLVVAPSWNFLRRCDELLAPFSARRLAIHNGTDAPSSTNPDRQDCLSSTVLTVCSLDEWKGVDLLIRAIAILRDAGKNARLVVAGDGPQRAALERLIAELRLQDQVQLMGWQSRESVARLLGDCTLFALASRFETFGIAALEAMAAGKAVIGTNVDGILEIVEHGKTGIIVNGEDPAALATAMSALLADGDLRARLGQAAQARVKDHFQRQQMGRKYTEVFQELIAHGA